jgi:hypothetical protein
MFDFNGWGGASGAWRRRFVKESEPLGEGAAVVILQRFKALFRGAAAAEEFQAFARDVFRAIHFGLP